MGIANFPFPSFTLLLTSDRVIIPGDSYVLRFAPLVDNNPNDRLMEEYPLANLDFDDDSIMEVALGHCDSEESSDEATSMSTGSAQRTVAGGGQVEGVGVGAGIKFQFPFLKTFPTARFQLKKILKRISQFKLNGAQ